MNSGSVLAGWKAKGWWPSPGRGETAWPVAEGWGPGERHTDTQTEAEQREEGSGDGGRGRAERMLQGWQRRVGAARLEHGGPLSPAAGQRCSEGGSSTGCGVPGCIWPHGCHQPAITRTGASLTLHRCAGAGGREGEPPFSLTRRKDEHSDAVPSHPAVARGTWVRSQQSPSALWGAVGVGGRGRRQHWPGARAAAAACLLCLRPFLASPPPPRSTSAACAYGFRYQHMAECLWRHETFSVL